MDAHHSNSFAALDNADEIIASAELQKNEKKQESKDQLVHLKQPLIWIDLEMTGQKLSKSEYHTQFFLQITFFFSPLPEHTITLQREPQVNFPIDYHYAGLDIENDHILQIACILSDGNLESLIEGEEFVIYQPEEIIASMNEWCIENHAKSGLTQAVRKSTVTLAEAEQRTLEFIQRHIPEPGAAQIAGNSVHVDINFLKKYMPSIVEYAHYRIVDVSSVGELCRRWFPRQYFRGPNKTKRHTAMSDVRESIEQLKYYKKAIFKAK